MGFISTLARQKKIEYLSQRMRPGDRVLEIGAGSGWLKDALSRRVNVEYLGIDIEQSADYVGDIKDWQRLGLKPASFDWIVGLEVVEHVPCFEEIHALLRPGGKAFLTSPVPHFDWACKILETIGLCQKRTSPHDHLIYFEKIPYLRPLQLSRKAAISQWGLFEKQPT